MNSLDQITAVITAGEAVQKGDLITVDSTGKGFYALPPHADGSMFRPISQPIAFDAINALQNTFIASVGIVADLLHTCVASAVLANGNIALAYTSTDMITLAVCEPNGVLLASHELGESDGVNLTVAIAASAAGFAVFFHSGSNVALNAACFDDLGTIVCSPSVIVQSTGGGAISADVLAGGQYLVAYAADVKHSPSFQIISPSTTVEGTWSLAFPTPMSVATLSVPVSSNVSISAVALQNGGFVITYGSVVGTAAGVSSVLYSSGNSILTTLSSFGTSLANCPNGPFVQSAPMTGGGYGVLWYGGDSTNAFQLAVFSAQGQLQGSVVELDSYDGNDYASRATIAGLVNGDIAVAWVGPLFGHGAVYSANGVAVSPLVNYGGGYTGSVAFSPNATGGVVVFQNTQSLDVSAVDFNLFTTPGAALTANTTIAAGTSKQPVFVLPVPLSLASDGSSLIAGSTGIVLSYGVFDTYRIDQQTLVGVAEADTAADEPLTVVIEGVVTLRLPFQQPYTNDARSNAIPGQCISVIGSTAILKGIQQ